jgi:hypothetical protein
MGRKMDAALPATAAYWLTWIHRGALKKNANPTEAGLAQKL